MTPQTWRKHTEAALDWALRSIDATGGRGSSHSWSPIFGWAKAYPETTGYLIETLFDYAQMAAPDRAHTLRAYAIGCGRWLLTTQLPEGAFPGLLAGHTKPSVFNTAQILFGLARLIREDDQPIWRHAAEKALDWLVRSLDGDGAWRIHNYVVNYSPTYHTRSIWGALTAAQTLGRSEYHAPLHRALQYYAGRFRPDGWVDDWGFWPQKPAFTHTIAYALEGFWHSSVLLNDATTRQKTIQTAYLFWENRQRNGRTAGRYGENGQGDYGFICPTGNAQLSVFYGVLVEAEGDAEFRAASDQFLVEILPLQVTTKWPFPARYGALPGSSPLWGPYLRLRYPNWAVKFFLDAMRIARAR